MKSLLEYKNLIMSTGLIPTIVCMILCIFFSDAYVLYACSLAGLLYVLYRLAKPPIYRPNLVFPCSILSSRLFTTRYFHFSIIKYPF